MNRQRLLEQIKADEGFSKKAFWDNDQFSYGYGCKAPYEGATITEEEAAILLEAEVNEAIGYFHTMFRHIPMNDVREEALVNMIFNLGPTKLRQFKKMLSAIELQDWDEAARQAQDSLWFLQTGGRARRIVEELRTGEKNSHNT